MQQPAYRDYHVVTPMVIAEYKSYLTSKHDWREAVRQLHRYQQQASLLLTPNVFCIAADEQELRYGTILFHEATKEDIERHTDTWGRWLSLYPEQKGYWNLPEADNASDPLEAPVKGLLRLKPCHLLDFLAHFVVFETKKNKTIKKIARYHQFEAVNDIVDRATGLIGKPVTPQDRTGLIWHTQGSGKSLTMIFAGNKLRRHPALDSPTVLIVVDRRDLKTQLGDDFDACDYPSVEKALGVEDLKSKLRTGWRGTLITTVQSFQRMGNLQAVQRDNIISLVDEAHRTQKGTGTDCERDIELNGRRVAYRLTRSKSARKLRARVGLDGVVVVLPAAREEAEAEEFLRANAGWVLAQLERIETLRRIRRPQLAASGTMLYRGEATSVCIVEHPYQRGAAQITHEEGRIVIARAADSLIPADRSLENWLRKRARTAIETELAPLLLRLNVTPNHIYLMEQRTKWGNCSALGNLSFNWRLILAPPFVLRYIVTHEAVHLAIPDHSRRFWLTVQSHCPEMERARQWLCANGHELWRSPLTPAAAATTGKAI